MENWGVAEFFGILVVLPFWFIFTWITFEIFGVIKDSLYVSHRRR